MSKMKFWNHKPKNKVRGGATRDRTADLLHAMQALSQLSYNPSTPQMLLDLLKGVKYFLHKIFKNFRKRGNCRFLGHKVTIWQPKNRILQ